jgi:hypothetical protein
MSSDSSRWQKAQVPGGASPRNIGTMYPAFRSR